MGDFLRLSGMAEPQRLVQLAQLDRSSAAGELQLAGPAYILLQIEDPPVSSNVPSLVTLTLLSNVNAWTGWR